MKVVLFFGGPSDERDVSAGSIKPWVTYLEADPSVHLTVVFVDRRRRHYVLGPEHYYANTCADFESQVRANQRPLPPAALEELVRGHDVAVPLIHGRYGEDGELQRLLEGWGVPYVFSRPDALAATLAKDRCYRLLAAAGFPVPRHLVVTRQAWAGQPDRELRRMKGLRTTAGPARGPVAVKPLASGSSLGVSVVERTDAALRRAVGAALADRHETAVMVEELLTGTEFSVVVLDGPGGRPVALAPTEVEKPGGSLVYGTREKYLHGSGALHHTPLRVPARTLGAVRAAAARAYAAAGLRHMARIDGFVADDGTVMVTDINGIGGMGFSSFVFQQSAMIGLGHPRLIAGLLAAARHPGTNVADAGGGGGGPAPGTRVHVILGGPTSERQVSRQSGCFVGLVLMASGYDVRFHLMDQQCRYTEIGLFYVLHHDVEEIAALVADPDARERVATVAARVASDFGRRPKGGPGGPGDPLHVGPTTDLAGAAAGADFVFLALHGGPGENGTLQLALEALGVPYNGSGPQASALASDKVATAATLGRRRLAGVRPPAQRPLALLEMGSWVAGPGGADGAVWDERYQDLRRRLQAPAVVVKPASDGCSTGVKVVRSGAELARFATAVVRGDDRYRTGTRRHDLRGGEQVITLPVPPPLHWVVEGALTEDVPVPLPRRDPNAANLAGWFAAKRFVELTCAVLDDGTGRLQVAVPSVTVAAEELTVDQKFQQGVGTNLSLDLFCDGAAVRSVRRRVGAVARALGLAGYGRIDCFWDRADDQLYVLEANTLCGLTEATVFYAQWLAGPEPLAPWAVLDRIVRAGLARHRRERP